MRVVHKLIVKHAEQEFVQLIFVYILVGYFVEKVAALRMAFSGTT